MEASRGGRRSLKMGLLAALVGGALIISALHAVLATDSVDEGLIVTKEIDLMTPHKGSVFRVKEEECKALPIKINKTCYMDVEKEEYYTCTKPVEEEVCEDKQFIVDAICRRPTKKKEPYDCSKVQTRKQCSREPVTVPETCYRKVNKKEPYNCNETKDKKTCSDVLQKVPAVCTRTVQKPYDCSKTVDVCEDKPKEKICKHTVMQKKPYTCSKTTFEQVCEELHEEDHSCGTTVVEEIPYDCSETVVEEDCTDAVAAIPVKTAARRKHARQHATAVATKTRYTRDKKVRREIQKPSKLKGPAAAPTKHSKRHGKQQQQHRMARHQKRAVATKTVTHKASACKGRQCDITLRHSHKGDAIYRRLTINRQHRIIGSHGKRGHNTRQHKRAGIASVAKSKGYSMKATKVGKTANAVETVKAKKTRAGAHAKRSGAAAHARKHVAKKCKKIEVVVNKTCYKKVEKKLSGKCPKSHKRQKHCKKVPVTVEDICYKEVPVHEERVCGTTNQRKCYTKQQPETCYRSAPETYDCSKEEIRQKCVTTKVEVPKVCYKSVRRREAYECNKTSYVKKCKDVEDVVPHTCYRAVESVEEYKCSKTDKKKQCTMQYVNTPANCQRKVLVQEPYDCSITEMRTQCMKPGHVTDIFQHHKYLTGASAASSKEAAKTTVFEKLQSTGGAAVANLEKHFHMKSVGTLPLIDGASMHGLKDLVKKNGHLAKPNGVVLPHLTAAGQTYFSSNLAAPKHKLLTTEGKEKNHVLAI